jgi:uncharacterized membrane protein YphA (DoxX/SURF4 family)
MNLLANGRLTDFGALILAIVMTVAILWAVIARAYRTEPARLVWPPTARREARRLADAADLAAANEAGH